jgi:hypothetical protein
MRRTLLRRRSLLFLGVVLLLAVGPVALLAATGTFNGALERQSARWTTTDAATSRTAWRNVPGLSLTRCTRGQVTAMLSVRVSGGPVRFRGVIDGVPEAPMKPGPARFVPNGSESFSYVFVANTAPFEADDTHRFDIQWQSATGAPVTLQHGVLDLLFEQGTQGCP